MCVYVFYFVMCGCGCKYLFSLVEELYSVNCGVWIYMCLALWECFVSVSVFAHVLLRCVCSVLLCVCHCGDDAIMVCVLLWYMYVYVCIFVCVS